MGAIRWDAWHDGQPGRAVEYTLGPAEWHSRLPWYAKETGPDTVEIRADNQAVADAEIGNAADLGLDYFAFVWYNAHEGRRRRGHEPRTVLLPDQRHRDLVGYTLIITPEDFADPVQNADVLAYMRDPNWVKVDGRPLIFVGMAEVTSRQLLDDFRASSIAQGTGDPYIVYIAGEELPSLLRWATSTPTGSMPSLRTPSAAARRRVSRTRLWPRRRGARGTSSRGAARPPCPR